MAQTPIQADALYDLTRVVDAVVAPDGERVALLTREYDPEADESVRSLWVVPADGSREPHRLTRASDASSPVWSPDGSKLGFVAARERDPALRVGRDDSDETTESADEEDGDGEDGDGRGGDEEPTQQVWVFDMELGGDAQQVTTREEGVSAFDWGPAGERLVVAARDPTDEEQTYLDEREEGGPIEVERLQHKVDGRGWLDEVTTYLFVVDVATRETDRLDAANNGGYGGLGGLSPAWGPDDRIAFVANHTDRPDDNYVRDVYTIAPDGSDRTQVTDGDLSAGSPTWSPGGRLAFTGRDPENLYVPVDLFVTENGEYRSVSSGLDRTLRQPQWVSETELVAPIADEGWTRLARFGVEDGPERTFTAQERSESVGVVDHAGGTLAAEFSTPGGSDLYTVETAALDTGPDGEDPRTRLTALNAAFHETHPTPETHRLRFTGARDDEVEALAVTPPEFDPAAPDRRGLVLDIHGGPMAYDAPGFRFQDHYFTSRGYIVLKVNYHGSTSYGRRFCESLRGIWGTIEVADLLAGVDEVVDRGWADPDRLFPTGFSQGGVNTGYLVTADDRWAAAAAEHGIYDLRSSFGTDDSHNWLEADFGLPWDNPEAYDAASSITDVGNVETPLLLTAGENDHRCPPTQSEQLYVSVRKQGVDAKLVIYPGEHHNVGDPDRAIHRLEVLDDWFGTYDPERTVEDD
jgi:dipeptidyl aminopeptidase/acylaminoacyl peptidase